MKILKKRAFAVCVDSFLIGMLCESLRTSVPFFNVFEDFWFLLVVTLYLFKDSLFRNASLGKMIMGIRIYDNNWKRPKLLVLLKRNALMQTIGYAKWWKARFIDGNIIDLFDWERDKLGTRVIDKKVFKQLSEEAKQLDGDYVKNMTNLYNSYLMNLYMK